MSNSQAVATFPGGLKLAGQKSMSTQTPIQQLPLPKQLILPLQQNIGSAAQPTVEVGDKVLKGQKLAKADGHVSVCLHAPSSGTVIAIDEQPIPHPSGLTGLCVTIETDGEDKWGERQSLPNFRDVSPHDIRQLVREAGIVGLGGAGFPSFIKLNSGVHQTVEKLIINGAECEPYISCDDMLMRERADDILDGLEVMQYVLNAAETIIAIEDNKPQAIAAMKQALSTHTTLKNTSVMTVPTRYPTGGEKQLIQVVAGKQVPSKGLPIDIGIVCHNIGTTYAVGRAILHGEPLISRIVTISGDKINAPCNAEVLLGTPVKALLDFAQAERQDNQPFVVGGPMMGVKLVGDKLPITKTANCILNGIDNAEAETDSMPCIRCGDCASVCPAGLLPQQLYWHSSAKNFDAANDYNLFDCIECGCCDYVCPSKIPLVSYYRFAKTEIMNQERERTKSDHARERFESRLARLEREKLEKEERQRQRKAALAASKAKAEAATKATAPTSEPKES